MVYGDSIAYAGYGDDIASIVTLKHEEKRFHATDMDSEIHEYFNKELYMGSRYTMEKEKRKTCNSRGTRNIRELCEASEWYAVRVWRCSESIPRRTESLEMVSK